MILLVPSLLADKAPRDHFEIEIHYLFSLHIYILRFICYEWMLFRSIEVKVFKSVLYILYTAFFCLFFFYINYMGNWGTCRRHPSSWGSRLNLKRRKTDHKSNKIILKIKNPERFYRIIYRLLITTVTKTNININNIILSVEDTK